MSTSYSVSATPTLHVGRGKINILTSLIKNFGSKVLLITGARSFTESKTGKTLVQKLTSEGIIIQQIQIKQEPSPGMIDEAVQRSLSIRPDVVVAIGGGSVVDAGKAISAMIPLNEPVKNYLEGVGSMASHPGQKIPFIAVPTTSGTGSEATKNAVLSEVGEHGFKKSLRHNNFVPDVAILDADLTLSCPPFITATSGMDAFTQLLESYLSTSANPLTDTLALEGLRNIATSLTEAYRNGSNADARANMSLAAYLSGITLANAGLGLVHGFASSVGGLKDIPHGVICSSLMAPANTITVRKLRSKNFDLALRKYAVVGRLFTPAENKNDNYYIDHLLGMIRQMSAEMNIPTLGHYGMTSADFKKIIPGTDNKNNPISLDEDEMIEVISQAL